MACVEFIAINGDYTGKRALSNAINYVVAKKDKGRNKIGKARYIGGLGVDYTNMDKVVRQMWAIKKYYGKTDKRQLYHYCLSFTKDIEDAQQVYVIGKIIAEEFFSGYQVLFAVHEDSKSEHLHIHYIVNSVSCKTGLKWHMSKKDFTDFKKEIEKSAEQLLEEW